MNANDSMGRSSTGRREALRKVTRRVIPVALLTLMMGCGGEIDGAYKSTSLPDTFSTLRHMINSLNQMAFIFFPAEHDVKVGSLYTPP